MSILFRNITLVPMDPECGRSAADPSDISCLGRNRTDPSVSCPVIENAFVLVEGEKIAYVGTVPPEISADQIIDGRHRVLMPGLINAHTHVPMTALRGYADDYDLQTWLNQYIFPAEDKLNREIVSCFINLALAEMISSGTTSISDMYFFCDLIAASVVDAGMKANITRAIACMDEDFDLSSYHSSKEMIELVGKWHGYDNNRIVIEAGIHAEYTSNPKVWSPVAEYAASHRLGMQVHLSETRAEHENCIVKYGMTPAAVLSKYGVFDVPALAAHCVWVSKEDMALLAEKGVSAVNNPVSNMKLASGIAPVSEMLVAGVNVALGTDGVASNNSHDMFEEIKAAALAQKARKLDPLALTAGDALRMATVNGAKAQRRERECGMVRPGMDADLIMLDFDKPHLTPCHNVVSNLVYSARGSDVVMNMVRGKIIYKEGEFLTLDIEKVKYDVRKAAEIF